MVTAVNNPYDPMDTKSVWLKCGPDEKEKAYEDWKARFYAERGSKASGGMLARVKDGWFAGPAPLGYLNDDTHTRAGIVLDPEKAPLVREAFELLARGQSLRLTLKDITNEGLLAKNGKPLAYSSLQLMTGNPFYYGMIRYQGELYPGKHEPLITEGLFGKIQELLACRQKRNPVSRSSPVGTVRS